MFLHYFFLEFILFFLNIFIYSKWSCIFHNLNVFFLNFTQFKNIHGTKYSTYLLFVNCIVVKILNSLDEILDIQPSLLLLGTKFVKLYIDTIANSETISQLATLFFS